MNIPVIPYNSRQKTFWDLLIVVAIFASAILIPYRFIQGEVNFGRFYWIITFLFFLDIFVNFRTTKKQGINILEDKKEISKQYLRGWFWVDLLAAVPFAPLAELFTGTGVSGTRLFDVLTALTLIRFLKLARIPKIFLHTQESLEIGPSVMRLASFAFWFAIAVHVMALGWIAIGAADTTSMAKLTRPFMDQYIRALYWCTTTIATIGYGDYYPNHEVNSQIVYTIIVQIVGVGMYGYIIGNIASLIANIDVAKAEFMKKTEVINAYMHGKKIPIALQEKVRNYYTYLYSTQKSAGNVSFLSELPSTLSTDISLFLNHTILDKVNLFKGADEIFIREVVRLLEPTVFLPGDFIIRQGEYGDCMYFLSSGEAEVIVNGTVVARLTEGSPFGEAALLQGEKRNASIRTVNYCDVYWLSKTCFDELRAKYPEFDKKVQKIVADRKKETAEKTKKSTKK